jgi:catechol 2,3-dioxygenase-like lactoylglutathione lyase family enzyme
VKDYSHPGIAITDLNRSIDFYTRIAALRRRSCGLVDW